MICAGFGFRDACPGEDLERAFSAALHAAGVERTQVTLLSAPAFKPPLVRIWATALGTPVALIALETLQHLPMPTLTQSPHVSPRYGVGSIAEGCALAGALRAGTKVRLLGARVSAGSATCALAISESSS
jgi:cobalt-precorrin 5A hydrolase